MEFHPERFFDETGVGFVVGPEVGVSRLKVTHEASGLSEQRITYSVDVRGGSAGTPGSATST